MLRCSWRQREIAVQIVYCSGLAMSRGVMMCAVTQAMSSAEQSHIAERDNSSAVQRAEMQLETERDRGVDSVL